MGRVHLVGGEKGGVGKSVVARLLVQYWIDRAVSFQAFDSDRSHGALLRHYTGYAEPVDVYRMEDLDRIVDALEEGVEEVVVDLAAQTEAPFAEWVEAGDVLGLLERLGHTTVYWYVVDDGKDSVRLLSKQLDTVDDVVQLVCVRNHGRARDFRLFGESKLEARLLARGAKIVDLPRLHAGSMQKIDAYDKSFWAAIHNVDPSGGPCLSLMERQRAKIAIHRAHQAFREVLESRSGGPAAASEA